MGAFMGILFMFAVTLGVMFGGAVYSFPKSKARAHSILEKQRRLTDNDPRLIEAVGVRDAAIMGVLWGMIPCALFMVFGFLRLAKLGDALGVFFMLAIPSAIVFGIGAFLFMVMNYGDALRAENVRREGEKVGRYGRDVQKMHTVDNTRGEVLAKLEKTNQQGPLVLFC